MVQQLHSISHWPMTISIPLNGESEHMDDGMLPVKLLPYNVKCMRLVRLEKLSGMVPFNLFMEKSKVFRLVRLDKDDGIVPVSALLANDK